MDSLLLCLKYYFRKTAKINKLMNDILIKREQNKVFNFINAVLKLIYNQRKNTFVFL